MSKLKQRSALKSFLEAVLCKWLLRLLWVSLKMIDSLLNYRTALCMVMGQCSKSLEALWMWVSVSYVSLESVFRIFCSEPSSSVFLPSPMATAWRKRRGAREKGDERDAEAAMEKEKRNETVEMKWEQRESVHRKPQDFTCFNFIPQTHLWSLIVVYAILFYLTNLKSFCLI